MAKDLYEMIPRDRFATREELCYLTGWSDRKVRTEINRLRKNPLTVIISNSHNKGYKRPATENEIKQCIWESECRIDEETQKIEALKKALKEMRYNEKTGQLMLDF
jgi:cation transport regulator ChaC